VAMAVVHGRRFLLSRNPYIATATALRGKRASWAVVLGGVWRVTVGRGGCGRQSPYHAGSELLEEARRGGPRRARQAEAGGRAPRAAGPDRAHARRQQKRDAARSVRHRPALQQHHPRYFQNHISNIKISHRIFKNSPC